MQRTSDNVVIFAASPSYFDHAKAAMVNCRIEGEWCGDIALIVPQGTDTTEFSGRQIHILEGTSADGYYQKFDVFSQFFRQWDKALYLDCDILIQGNIASVFDTLHKRRQPTIIADREENTLEHCFTFWIDECNRTLKEEGKPFRSSNTQLHEWVWRTHGQQWRQYNTAMLLFRPDDIPSDAIDQLHEMCTRIQPINTHCVRGTDQPVINLVFYNMLSDVINKEVSCWSCPNDNTKIIHYCSGYAPWIDKPDAGMDAYANPQLGESCHAVYTRNLQQFDSILPKEDL